MDDKTTEPAKSLHDWLMQQLPSAVAKVSIKHSKYPVLHVGGKVKCFTPRIPCTPTTGEDQTIPRICCADTLFGCLYGGRHHCGDYRLYLYEFDERDVVIPSVQLTKEPKRKGEVWIVPHRMSNWTIAPNVVGELRLSKVLAEDTGSDLPEFFGNDYIFYSTKPIRLTSDITLTAEQAYRLELRWKASDMEITNITPVDKSEYDKALSTHTVLR